MCVFVCVWERVLKSMTEGDVALFGHLKTERKDWAAASHRPQ